MRQLKTKNFTETGNQSRVRASVADHHTAAPAHPGNTEFISQSMMRRSLLFMMTGAAAQPAESRQTARIAARDYATSAAAAVYDA